MRKPMTASSVSRLNRARTRRGRGAPASTAPPRPQARSGRRARTHDARLPARSVEQLRADYLGRAVAVPVVVSKRGKRLRVVRLGLFALFRLRRLVLVSLLALHHNL